MSEAILKVGKKGEIYTNKKIREKTGITPGGFVKATVKGNRLIIEALPRVEDLIRNCVMTLSPEEAEKISEEIQEEETL